MHKKWENLVVTFPTPLLRGLRLSSLIQKQIQRTTECEASRLVYSHPSFHYRPQLTELSRVFLISDIPIFDFQTNNVLGRNYQKCNFGSLSFCEIQTEVVQIKNVMFSFTNTVKIINTFIPQPCSVGARQAPVVREGAARKTSTTPCKRCRS